MGNCLLAGHAVGGQVVVGSYTGTGQSETQTITLGFQPKAVLVASHKWGSNYYRPQMMNLALPGVPAENVSVTSTGFQVCLYFNQTTGEGSDMNPYRYIAFR